MHSSLLFATSSLLLAASLPHAALGHGNIVNPAAVWKAGYPQNGYASTVDNAIWGAQDGSVYGYGTNGTLKYFEKNFATSGYKTLKDLVLAKQEVLAQYGGSAACGYTIEDDAKRAALPSTITYSGFTHPGPCEVWCDNTKLVYALDCQTTYPGSPASVPIDSSKCKGADRLTVYWLGVHGAPWQVFTDCVWLTGSTGGGSSAGSVGGDDDATTTAPATTTATPTASASADSSTSQDETTTTAPTTATPATTTATPATTAKTSCTKRRRV